MYNRHSEGWHKHLDFMLIDTLCLNIAFVLAYIFRFHDGISPYRQSIYLAMILLMCAVQLIASMMMNTFENILKRDIYTEIKQVFMLDVIILASVSLILYMLHVSFVYSRILTILTMILFFPLSVLFRCGYKKILLTKAESFEADRALAVITESRYAAKLVKEIRENKLENFDVKVLVLTDCDLCSIPQTVENFGTDKIISLEEAPLYICRNWIDEVLIYGSVKDEFMDICREMGVTVHTVLGIKNVDAGKQFVEQIGERSVLTSAFNYMRPYQAVLKRTFDIAASIFGCLATALIYIFIAPIIKIKSPGPVFFSQTRIGQNGKKFKIYKFRSMYLDAEERKKEFEEQNRVSDGMMFKLEFDPRVIGNEILPDGTRKTGIGEFIRKTSLDEFPQFINVLKGEMSVVGTRPPTVDEWEKYEYHHRARLAMKPGITGLWQVSGRSKITDFEEVVKLDTEYITSWRVASDIKIILKTFAVLATRRGAM